MGLGLLGRGVGVAKFLAECGAVLTVTDLKDKIVLAPSLAKLKKYQNIRYVLGEHRLEDFRSADMIIKAAGVPLDSPFIAEARARGVPIKMDASLFAELASVGVCIVGVTGTRGKSTTTQLIYEIVQHVFARSRSDEAISTYAKATADKRFARDDDKSCRSSDVRFKNTKKHPRVFLAGNVRGTATLPLLKKVQPGDFVVLELDSWQLQGFGDAKISPHVAVFTTFFDDHLNYYNGDRGQYLKDKAQIFLSQVTGNREPGTGTLIVGEQAAPAVRKHFPAHAQRMIVARVGDVPQNWKLTIPGEHNRYNAACALAAADALGVPRTVSKHAVESFRGLPGRLELVRELSGVKIYNDTCATTPDATLAALRALDSRRQSRRIILIMGGADKGLDMSALLKEIPKYCRALVLLAGSGTDRLIQNTKYKIPTFAQGFGGAQQNTETVAATLRDAIRRALGEANRGDKILFSPSFASFGMFKNEYDRGEQFVKIVRSLRP
jgi:UDP-N-acetylmuramoylalanine--D-glutamate ligase